jgi:SAM-dependent methyltransferase
VVSNNGFNNVADLAAALRECRRVCRPQAELALTMNLDGTMGLLYDELRAALAEAGLAMALPRVEAHIRRKRPPLPEVHEALRAAGFSLSSERRGAFALRFVDAEALFGHHLIRRGFLPAWREIPPADRADEVLKILALRLDALAREQGELRLDVPFVCLTAVAIER